MSEPESSQDGRTASESVEQSEHAEADAAIRYMAVRDVWLLSRCSHSCALDIVVSHST